MTGEELIDPRRAYSADTRRRAALEFVHAVLDRRGAIDDATFGALAGAGFTNQETAGILAHVGFNVFANYFNLAAATTPDFPPVSLETSKAA